MFRFLVVIITIFLVAFPKGGFKVGSIPVTWGYILLLIAAGAGTIALLYKNGTYFKKERQLTLWLALPFIIYSSVILLFSQSESLGFVVSFYLSVVFFPIIFLYILNSYIDSAAFERVFIPSFLNCVRFVSVFGLFLFIYKLKTTHDFQIPYLTVNIEEVNKVDDKFNMRGDISKLTSTYNNGNIFGVSLMLLLPLYFEREKNLIFKIVLLAALLLTLSRTVWIGMVLYLLLYVFTRLNTVKGWITLLSAILIVFVGGPLLLNLMGKGTSFLVDSNLGGRAYQLAVLDDIKLWGNFKYQGLTEIIYLSIISNFGIVGFFLFVIYIFSPVLVKLFKKILPAKDGDPDILISKHAVWGPLIYTVMAASDGAMLFIPVMAFFWFISSYSFKPEIASL